ncbi:MAG: RluA family pseudouridine synthase [Aerococcus sp.]|nr:RluA family pseudouridine synthase [Aerococcus sp.]
MGLQFQWQVDRSVKLKTFLQHQRLSRSLIVKLKRLGRIWVNDQSVPVTYPLDTGDTVTIELPDEGKQEEILPKAGPLAILYEDQHFLIVNKSAGVHTLPVRYHDDTSLASTIKYYYQTQQYDDQVIHPVSRLDGGTSGAVMFAKHQFAHAVMAQEMANHQLAKYYTAWTERPVAPQPHGVIDLPIGREEGSIIKRRVRDDGKSAQTEYWLKQQTNSGYYQYRVQLHTGRTHQIRVHFAHMGAPLVGDDLYGEGSDIISHQALHCRRLVFTHPFLDQQMTIEAPYPEAFVPLMDDERLEDSE